MATPVLMPKQGQSVEFCIITEWMKQKGDKVTKGDILFSYETDKASFEEEAPADGILLETFYSDGDEVPVLTNVAVIGNEGESADEYRPGGEPDKAEATHDKPSSASTRISEPEIPESRQPEDTSGIVAGEKVKISPRAKRKATELGLAWQNISGTGPYGRIIEQDVEIYAESGSKLSGLAQERMEKEPGLYPPAGGSGLGGRVLDHELTYQPASDTGDFIVKKISNVRRIIAQNMHASLQNSAQLTHHMSADARKMMALRKKIKTKVAEENYANVTLNDMVCFAVIRALKKMPEINSHFLGDSIRTFNKVHLGIAVDTERGLMVPSLRNADDLNIEGLSNQLKFLAESCKKGSIDPELLASTAASFTVSNLGAFGVEMFTPVINLPQAGILGVNTITYRPADTGGGVIGFVPHIGLSLTYDHRVLDGAPASAFLREIKEQIEHLDITL